MQGLKGGSCLQHGHGVFGGHWRIVFHSAGAWQAILNAFPVYQVPVNAASSLPELRERSRSIMLGPIRNLREHAGDAVDVGEKR